MDGAGRRFTDVAEVYFFRVVDGRITRVWGLEDTIERLRQLLCRCWPRRVRGSSTGLQPMGRWRWIAR